MVVNSKKAYNWFVRNFVMKKSTQGWYAFDNPFDPDGFGKRKMAVHLKYQLVKCWKTGYKDYITQFVMDYTGANYRDAMDMLNSEEEADIDLTFLDDLRGGIQTYEAAQMPFGFKSILEGEGILGQRCRNYLTSRGFDIEELDLLGFGYCDEKGPDFGSDYFGYIIIPFKKRGSLFYFIGRDFIGSDLRYKNPSVASIGVNKADLFYNEDALELRSKVYLTEGWSDAATMGKRGIASLGWSLSSEQKGKILKSQIKRLVIIPDVGADNKGVTFYKKAVELTLDFLDHKEVVVLDYIAAGMDKFGKDTNEIGRERTLELEKVTEPLTYAKAMEIII